jgi:hypoxanthine phosphoribosyltransferase
VLLRLLASGSTRGIRTRRADGVVRPLLPLWREETEAYCAAHGLRTRSDSTNGATKRGLIRNRLLPLLEELDPRARASLLALAAERPRLPRALEASLVGLCSSLEGTRSADLGGGVRAVRAYDELPLAAAGGPARREAPEGAGCPRGRQGAAGRARRLAARRDDRRRRRGGAGPRRGSRLGGRRARDPGAGMTSVHADVGEVLIDEDALRSRIVELGAEISADYEGRDLLLVGVLKGAIFFISDLMRELTVPCEIDFMAISSYGAATDSSGVVRILKDLELNIAGRDVLVVEDIIDSGLTLSYLRRTLGARKPASLEICALLTKPERREVEVPVRYVGFEIPNRFVIGYGLDFAERYRNLPYVAVLHADLVPPAL